MFTDSQLWRTKQIALPKVELGPWLHTDLEQKKKKKKKNTEKHVKKIILYAGTIYWFYQDDWIASDV